ncbi:uncharacterized protein LOC143203250 [Rhynchophorus ferrugineus]|uniref:uncharacterized protein LOC143203250 n=1 Tax=Rhynchophorus ferrugineus TaxID=354439 RepID=UPI003FCDF87F
MKTVLQQEEENKNVSDDEKKSIQEQITNSDDEPDENEPILYKLKETNSRRKTSRPRKLDDYELYVAYCLLISTEKIPIVEGDMFSLKQANDKRKLNKVMDQEPDYLALSEDEKKHI